MLQKGSVRSPSPQACDWEKAGREILNQEATAFLISTKCY